MQNEIQVFQSKKFGKVRAIEKDGQPWFVGKDVAMALGYADPNKAIATHVGKEDKLNDKTALSLGQRGGWMINESGLYCLILSSKLPTARAFKRWVTSEVLPTIRQHGAYISPETLRRMRDDREFTSELLETIAQMQPKAQYFDAILQSPQAFPISVISKEYGMSAFAFNKLLHELGVQYRVGKVWLLYKDHANQGYTATKTYLVGDKEVSIHTCWTMKGRLFIYELLKYYGILPQAEYLFEEVA